MQFIFRISFFFKLNLQFDCFKVFFFSFFLIDVKYGAICWNVNSWTDIDHELILNHFFSRKSLPVLPILY